MPHTDTVEERDLREDERIVGRMLEQALDWRQEHLDPLLEEATEYYLGKPFGDEEEGRSQIVMTEVRDTTRALLSALVRIFFGPDRVVEFDAEGPEDEPLAEQRTDYVQYIIERDNPGFDVAYAAFKDALIRKLGIVKYWWEDMVEIKGSEHSGLSPQQVDLLAAEDGVSVEARVTKPAVTELVDPETGQPTDDLERGVEIEIEPAEFNAKVRREVTKGRVKIAAVPPEEFVWNPTARSRDDARLIGHVRELPASDLIAMGVDEDLIRESIGKDEDFTDNTLEISRSLDFGTSNMTEDEGPEETRPVRFADLYVKIALGDDEIATWRHIQAVGPQAKWVDEDPPIVEEPPFALFQMDPEPHTMVGTSVFDDTGDLQKINSFIVRGMLDSLALHLNPATEVVEGRVNIKDLLNPEIGRVVRVKQPGMMREVETPFVGGSALPVLQYMEEIRENRTGQSKAAAGLDADALQSSTKAAVAATVSAAAQRQELIARIFAEGGMTQLFRGVLRLITENQDRERVVRLRGEWVEVDPRSWNANMDVRVNVALGTGRMEDRLQTLVAASQKMEEHLAQGSPLGSYAKLRAMYARISEMSGFVNVDALWPTLDEIQRVQKQQAENQPPSENEIYREVEMAKIQARQQQEQAKIQLKIAELEVERERVARDIAIREAELEHKIGSDTVDKELEVMRESFERQEAAINGLKTLAEIRVGE